MNVDLKAALNILLMNKSDNLPTMLSKLVVLAPQKRKCRHPGDSRKRTPPVVRNRRNCSC